MKFDFKMFPFKNVKVNHVYHKSKKLLGLNLLITS